MAQVSSNTVEVCIFTLENDQPRYLLLHRSRDEKIYPDLWQFVSGSIETDERAVDAAMRELEEETGLKPIGFWVVPFVNSFYDPERDSVNLSPLFAAQVEIGQTPRLSGEHSEFSWLAYEAALRKLVWPGQREGMKIVHEYIIKGEQAGRLTRIL